jgi:glycosyltransferase involved in cell wall biosynthesis
VGAGPLFIAAQHYIQAFRLENRVTLHGVTPNDEVLRLMKRADVFIQHSVTCPETGDEEGMPVAILEAMAYGLPVVSTFHAGIPEAVVDGKTGFLVEEGDTQSMADRILDLASQPALRVSVGGAGRARVETNFTWQKEKRSLVDLLTLGVL